MQINLTRLLSILLNMFGRIVSGPLSVCCLTLLTILKKFNAKTARPKEAELKSLRNLRLCVDEKLILHIDGRLVNAELPVDTKHPIILPSKHPLLD